MDYKKEGKEIIEGIIIAVVLYLVISFTLSYALKVDNPVAVVISGSMEPVYYRGDIIVIKGTDPSSIQIGDIVVYKRPYQDIPIVHRAISIIEEEGTLYFVTKGDNNPFEDSYFENGKKLPGVPEYAILGKSIMKMSFLLRERFRK
ncbi:MAG: Peptidase S24-like protein [Candidatus Methanofastidiosum methylothiophilum]|uniref:Peptidase S24-like protein n=1 Tax=Candidatus Methanofastidiosum methylothiophilum TaxID=1705564 RepID=A0A150IVA6_9EURY|nr:MAG: Peptidase S24-like protein [Candidatus Methanofastidiosum methylthiophilus]